jgi:hypothetical protein
MCPEGDSPTHHSGCESEVTFDVAGTSNGRFFFTIGSNADGEFGFQNLMGHIQELSGSFTFDDFGESCALSARQEPNHFVLEGWLSVITRARRIDNHANLTDMTVDRRIQHVIIRYQRFLQASAYPVRIWMEQMFPGTNVSHTKMFASHMRLFETESFRVIKQMASYEVGETIYAQHFLPVDEMDD